jgi:hypothetical protein
MNALKLPDGQYTGPSGVIYTEIDAAAELLQTNRLQIDPDELQAFTLADDQDPREATAILERYLFVPNKETVRFAQVAQQAGLSPQVSTFRDTDFTTVNPEKVAALRPPYFWPKGQVTKKWLVAPPDRWGGIGTCPTTFGITAEEYWSTVRALRANATDLSPDEAAWLQSPNNTADNSTWYTRLSVQAGDSKASSDSYYPGKSAAYLTRAVLFEDFEGGPSDAGLQNFVQSRVLPAQEELYKRFGTVPLVVRLPAASDNLEVDMRNLTDQPSEAVKQAGQEFTQ